MMAEPLLQQELLTATVELGLTWDFSPSALRGAVLAALAPDHAASVRLHSDWNGRLNAEEGETLSRPAPICFRVHGRRAELYLYGPRTLERLADLGGILSLCDPEGAVRPLTPTISIVNSSLGIHSHRWYRYRLLTPWWPPGRAWARRPKALEPTSHHCAWLAQSLLTGALGLLRQHGVDPGVIQPTLHIEKYTTRAAAWHRDDRALHTEATGFLAEFTTNLILPPGLPLGKHAAEGYGKVVPL